ncbi:MAG TPA: tetratricopeptide repeat protein [Lacipirellula sp.]
MIVNQSLNRALLLYQHSRYQEAEQELRGVLAQQPHSAQAHSLLALCVLKQERLDEAQSEAEQAIALEPDWPRAHYVRSAVLEHRNRFAEAEASAREAVRLDASDPDNYARLGFVKYRQGDWLAAFTAAEKGLSFDAEHGDCGNLRTLALTKLGRRREAIANVDQSLARNPDDAFAHANKGWALLHQGQPRPALEHFREALRLDPTFEYAKSGMVEALKAHNPIYRWILAYFLWMARLSDRARWGVIIGGYVGYRVLRGVARTNPEIAPWITPLLVLYFIFVLMTWFAMPLFNLLLRLNRFGRYALSRDMRVASNWFALCLVVFAGGLAAYFWTGLGHLVTVPAFALGMALPLTALYFCDPGWPRRSMAYYTATLGVVGTAAMLGALLEYRYGPEVIPWAFRMYQLFLLGVFVTPWAANYFASATVRR